MIRFNGHRLTTRHLAMLSILLPYITVADLYGLTHSCCNAASVAVYEGLGVTCVSSLFLVRLFT